MLICLLYLKNIMMKYFSTIGLLFLSNSFMTLAWYGHLKYFGKAGGHASTPVFIIILISWGIAFFEYCFQVPANRIGSSELGGPFSLVQLKVIQEVITLVVFVIFSKLVFNNLQLSINHVIGFGLLVAAVYFIFKG
jgi:uncharacterized protein (DUF486 family)